MINFRGSLYIDLIKNWQLEPLEKIFDFALPKFLHFLLKLYKITKQTCDELSNICIEIVEKRIEVIQWYITENNNNICNKQQ